MHSLFLIAFDGNHLVDTQLVLPTTTFQFMSFNLHTTQTTHRCMFYDNDKLEFKRHCRQRHSMMMTAIFKVKAIKKKRSRKRKQNPKK